MVKLNRADQQLSMTQALAAAAKADFLLLRRYKYDLITGTVLLQSKTPLHTKRNESELKGTVQFSERSLL